MSTKSSVHRQACHAPSSRRPSMVGAAVTRGQTYTLGIADGTVLGTGGGCISSTRRVVNNGSTRIACGSRFGKLAQLVRRQRTVRVQSAVGEAPLAHVGPVPAHGQVRTAAEVGRGAGLAVDGVFEPLGHPVRHAVALAGEDV